MSRLFGFMCNEPERISCALAPAKEALVAKGVTSGWGLAFFQGGEVLLQRHPKAPAGAVLDFFAQVRDLRTDYLVGVVAEQVAGNKLENTQPFRFRSWVFAQSGVIHGFPSIQAGLLQNVPDFLRRNIRGHSDSEHAFHLFLAFLHDSGKLDDPNVRATDVASALAGTIATIDRLLGGAAPSAVNFVVTNGRSMLAVRRGRPMWARKTEGIVDCPVCRESTTDWRADRDRRRVTHEHLRSVLVASEPEKTEGAWEEVPESSVFAIGRDLTTSVLPLKT
jgi:glutamine amidotransferase